MECGIFSYCGRGAGRDLVVAAMSVARWGMREWGVVGMSANGQTCEYQRFIDVDDVRKDIDRKLYRIVGGAECVLGYVRSASCSSQSFGLATCGPKRVGYRSFAVLNGEISQAFRDRAYFLRNDLADAPDAEVVGTMAASLLADNANHTSQDVVTAFGRTIREAIPGGRATGMFLHWGKFCIIRNEYPLWVSSRKSGSIIASVPWDTGREPCMIGDDDGAVRMVGDDEIERDQSQ